MITTVRNHGPLIVSIPHAGTEIPEEIAATLVSLPRARRDVDLYIDRLYAFAFDMGATIVRTSISRTVIDVNRDPSGKSLYPGQTTTGLCPTETFDGDPLYLPGREPDAAEIARRRTWYFDPYHLALETEIARLRADHPAVVLYEAHSIRSLVPRLFEGELPQFNLGTNSGKACGAKLVRAVEAVCDASGCSRVTDGRFKGGWTTRQYGRPRKGVHAIQMELAMRAYLDEVPAADWPPAWDPLGSAECQSVLRKVIAACLDFAKAKA
jgi:formiminoglutamase